MNSKQFVTKIDSPVGPLTLVSDGKRLVGLYLNGHAPGRDLAEAGPVAVLDRAKTQLEEYFAGKRSEFDLPLAPEGTSFQQTVWRELCRIPYGQTISYGELARRVGNPRASRAVGLANGQNPIAIIIPCHRVIGADGSLTGYGGGLPIKKALLALESPGLF